MTSSRNRHFSDSLLVSKFDDAKGKGDKDEEGFSRLRRFSSSAKVDREKTNSGGGGSGGGDQRDECRHLRAEYEEDDGGGLLSVQSHSRPLPNDASQIENRVRVEDGGDSEAVSESRGADGRLKPQIVGKDVHFIASAV